jgi:two-component system cell cycle response regulator
VGLPRLTGRAFRDLAIYMGGFGLLVGVVFPFAVVLLGVPAEHTLRPSFQAACLFAGLLVGLVAYVLARLAIGVRLGQLVEGMGQAAEKLRVAADTGDVSAYSAAAVPVDSADDFGRAASAYNDLLGALERAQRVENTITALSAATTGPLDETGLAAKALDAACLHDGVTGGAVGPVGGHAGTAWASRDLTPEQVHAVLSTAAARGQFLLRPQVAGTVLAVLPLVHLDEVIGVVGLELTSPPDDAMQRMARVLADHLGVALSNARLHHQMTVLATVDDLTGIHNRRAGMARLESEIRRCTRSGRPLGVLLLDLDHFKSVNDTYGHRVGDRVLAHVTRVCGAALRPADLLARYGGEELVAILPDADAEAVTVIAERLRRAVADEPTMRPDGDPVPATVTVGGISWTPRDTADVDALLTAADVALYAGKSAGRNRSVIRVLPAEMAPATTIAR